MTDLELLEKYEPVLRFAKSERFFPMAVEPYLERCSLFPDGPQGAAELFAHLNEPLIHKIGSLKSEQYFLRFVNRPLNDFDAWIWWVISSILGAAAGWFFFGLAGLEIVVAASLIGALIIFMLASPIRLRIIPAVLAVIFFLALGIAPVWFFLRPSEYVSIGVEYLILLPIYLLFLFYSMMRVLKFIIEHILPEGPGLIMDMLSQATEKIAQEAYHQYAEILKEHPQPVYYGRVLHEADERGSEWTILQYHFFYAFNDWRLAANGMNHHEGDWEMAAVYLKNGLPHSLLLSQHGAGNIEKWQATIKAVDENGKETTHPVVYVALGSHANYSKPDIIRSPGMYRSGRVQRLLFWIDGLIRYLFLLFNPDQKARNIALKEVQEGHLNIFTEHAFDEMVDETDHYVVSLPMEIAAGDGFRIRPAGVGAKAPYKRSVDYLKEVMSEREVARPAVKEWKPILLNSKPGWVQYKGLWGVKSLLNEESGPRGPKWERPVNKHTEIQERVRWSKPLDWLVELENLKH
ncbi:MAG: DUF3995 domain-containing protein [Anaerolineaceae bacterium]|nr:MAG: DUF3995 domain-containing protein [Anaerolineaceae bacterium]